MQFSRCRSKKDILTFWWVVDCACLHTPFSNPLTLYCNLFARGSRVYSEVIFDDLLKTPGPWRRDSEICVHNLPMEYGPKMIMSYMKVDVTIQTEDIAIHGITHASFIFYVDTNDQIRVFLENHTIVAVVFWFLFQVHRFAFEVFQWYLYLSITFWKGTSRTRDNSGSSLCTDLRLLKVMSLVSFLFSSCRSWRKMTWKGSRTTPSRMHNFLGATTRNDLFINLSYLYGSVTNTYLSDAIQRDATF